MHHVLELLEKDLFVNIKVICVIIDFVEGVFAKFSAFIAWQHILLVSLYLK